MPYADKADKKANNRKWVLANPQKMRESRRKWKQTHWEETLASRRKWAKVHPDRNREKENRRRVRKFGNKIEKISFGEIWDRDSGICGICHCYIANGKWELDHIVPISKGGQHIYANVQVAHPTCNRKKGARYAN